MSDGAPPDEPDVGAQIGAAATGPTKPDLTPEGVARRANAGCGCLPMLGVVAVLLVISLVWGALSGDEGGSDDSGSSAGAFGVCTQFVEDRLRAPGTASFPNQFQDDGEVTITGGPDVFTVSSHVDAENGFGGEVRTPFVCEVRHVDGENWQLVDLSLG